MENREQLIEAVGQLLARAGTFTLTELAEHAGVSRATTYRNFSDPGAAIDAFIAQFLTEFETEVAALPTVQGLNRLVGLCQAWARLVEARSPALLHVRSTEGFLSRARRDDPIIGRIHRLVRAVLTEAMVAGALPATDLDYAVFLWNLLLDPRELVDLAEHQGTSVAQAAERLTTDYLVILAGRK